MKKETKDLVLFLGGALVSALYAITIMGTIGLFPMTSSLTAFILFVLLVLNDNARKLVLNYGVVRIKKVEE